MDGPNGTYRGLGDVYEKISLGLWIFELSIKIPLVCHFSQLRLLLLLLLPL